MSRTRRGWLALGAVAAWAVAPVAPSPLFAAETPAVASRDEAVRLDQFESSSADRYFMLSLAPAKLPAAQSHDVVIAIDTSASQTGEFRDKSIAAVEAVLASLGENDRVRLIAADVETTDLTEGFISPRDAADAIAKLQARVPLGSTDMPAMLSGIVERFDAKSTTPRAAIYIGDGKSVMNLLDGAEWQGAIAQLTSANVPVTSYAIGPECDNELLAALANQTGGNLAIDSETTRASDAGAFLAKSADAPVAWVKSLNLPEGITAAYPSATPPLRSDRETILIGQGGVDAGVVKISAETSAGALSFNVPAGAPSEDHSYLAKMVDMASRDDGSRLPLVGLAGLREAKLMLQTNAHGLVRLAQQAVATGALDEADQLAAKALALDPSSNDAAAVKEQVASERKNGPDARRGDLVLANFQAEPLVAPVETVPAPAAERFAEDGAFADQVLSDRQVMEQYMRNMVRNSIDQARRLMSTDPDASISALKLLMEDVSRALDLEAEVRGQLQDQIEGALRTAETRLQEKVQRDIERQAFEAGQRDRQLALQALELKENKLDQLMDRFDALMDEERYTDAWAVGEAVREMAPRSPAANAAYKTGEFARYYHEAIELRRLHDQMTLATLESVNVSAVPMDDQEPIIYPDREVWLRLTKAREKYKQVDLATRGPAEARIFSALEETTSLQFLDQPLLDVVAFLEDRHNIEIQLDTAALDAVGVTSDTPVTIDVEGISLKSALRLMLKSIELTYTVRDEVLMITTPDEVETQLVTKVYPVADLVVPIQSQGLGGGMMGGMMGGGMMGGGMGGMGGGMGGMGGGMGGMGGGMGGMGGGGFFNVRPDLKLPFRNFAVKDDVLRLKGGKAKAPATQAAPVATTNSPAAQPATATAEAPAAVETPAPAPVEKIELTVGKGQDAGQVWNDYFAANTPDPAAVRQVVRERMGTHQFGEVVAIIQGALRNQQTQPWMYEALAIALQADKRPAEEVERTLLSAADFAQSPDELMRLADYLQKAGYEKRALGLFKEVSQLAPLNPEPCIRGLAIAQRLTDDEGIRWASLGILSQAWTADQTAIWDQARRAANSLLTRLESAEDQTAFTTFQKQLEEALSRDVVVIVSWTGDADIDLIVEEPTKTACSFRAPRTAGGGVLLGDTLRSAVKNPDAKMQEIYVCPRGFAGEYKVVLHRVWGKLAGGKATVEVFKNYGTPEAKYQSSQIELADDPAMVLFDVEKGRREEPIDEVQLAGAVAGQLEMGRHILAQQMALLNDDNLARNLIANRILQGGSAGAGDGSGGIGGNGNGNGNGIPFFARGAVGYQPVIITLPQGASMSATAVISADRRYVRISASPIFSQITQVQTFNFANGQSGNGQVPQGGGLGGFGGGAGSGATGGATGGAGF